jgi:hypothetical protein
MRRINTSEGPVEDIVAGWTSALEVGGNALGADILGTKTGVRGEFATSALPRKRTS